MSPSQMRFFVFTHVSDTFDECVLREAPGTKHKSVSGGTTVGG